MKVKELITRLQDMNPDSNIFYIYDGCCRVSIEHVFSTKDFSTMVVGANEYIYRDKDRPMEAVSENTFRDYMTPYTQNYIDNMRTHNGWFDDDTISDDELIKQSIERNQIINNNPKGD